MDGFIRSEYWRSSEPSNGVRRGSTRVTTGKLMIINDPHEVVFVHVPKCGGTSIRLQLAEMDSYKGAFQYKGEHPDLGKIHYAHIPLQFLSAAFPDAFDKVSRYKSFALLRDPFDRFASATFQRLEEFG